MAPRRRQARQPMPHARRLDQILEQLAATGTVAVGRLAARLGVSEATIRRDLDRLEQQRLVSRTHGGAVAPNVLFELPLRYRAARREGDKLRIAKAACDRLGDATSIGLTGGTTTSQVARRLAERSGLTIVTNALNVASELAVRPAVKIVVTGGVVRPESYELIGPFAEATLAQVNLDVAVLGVDGVHVAHGLTTHHEAEAHTDRALIERARRVLVVADSTKIGLVAFARICPLEAASELVTDARADPSAVAEIRERGVEVILV